MTQKSAALAVLLACAALSNPAFATATASASLQGFSLSLVDLQYDFYGPSFGWIAEGPNSNSQVVVSVADDGSYTGQYNVGFAGLRYPTSTTADFGPGLAHASAAFSGDGSIENYGLAVSGSANGSVAGVKNYFGAAAYVNYGIHYSLGNFVLGPQTQVTFSALSSVALHTDSPMDEYADARAGFSVDYQGQNFGDGIGICSEPPFVEGPPTTCTGGVIGHDLSFSELLSVTLSNPTNASVVGTFYAGAVANGSAMTSAVPEPASYGLFASGLALMGLVLRRRRSLA
ncbi:PEP-CTERM sorting domain-containing protein [Niveibacterium sp. SC-1]|uniref:PEP-CTERM sorting domain-containing protein n=1 Tax=Niveibacterium sp. SC-1 TaxID=3135646 RepID=UPI00311DD2AC